MAHPKAHISSQSGRRVVITGANTGIGRVAAVALAEAGAEVILACRSAERTASVLEEIGPERGHFVPLDLGSLGSVRAAADSILADGRPIDCLINNAGLAGNKGLTTEGFERTFGVNHLGHYLFTRMLLPLLIEAAPARIVTIASRAHTRARRIRWDKLHTEFSGTVGMDMYQVSKLANVLFSAELGRRLEGTGITTYSLHPGVVATDIWRRLPGWAESLVKRLMITSEEGAQTTLHCAASDEAGKETGLYYDKCRVKAETSVARDQALAKELWDRSAEWVGLPAELER
ncbi:MAG: retinol dehydrogenase-12, partial [Bradymonadia bacterium]